MYRNHLLKLADLLDHIKVEEFNIHRWQDSCGTVACAIGHAAKDPYFQELGLTLMKPETMPTGCYSEGVRPHFEGEYGFVAAAKLFGISYDDAERLFSFVGYAWIGGTKKVHPSDVAQRIRLFVDD